MKLFQIFEPLFWVVTRKWHREKVKNDPSRDLEGDDLYKVMNLHRIRTS